MATNPKLELEVTVDEQGKAKVSLKELQKGLDGLGSAGEKGGRRASAGMDDLTASMMKGVVGAVGIIAIFEKVTGAIKDLTIESVKLAAHNEYAAAMTMQLAKLNGLNADATMKYVEAVKARGYHDEEALLLIGRMIRGEMDLTKAVELAEVVKNAAAFKGVERSEALLEIEQAIEAGRSRGLKQFIPTINLEKEWAKAEYERARALTEVEKRDVSLQAVLKEGAKMQGVNAAAVTTTEGAWRVLIRAWTEAKEVLGAGFLPVIHQVTDYLMASLPTVKTYAVAMGSLLKSQLGIGGKALEEFLATWNRFTGKYKGAGVVLLRPEGPALPPKPEVGAEPDYALLKEIRKRQAEALRTSQEQLASTLAKAVPAPFQTLTVQLRQLRIESEKEIKKLSTFIDEFGVEHKLTLNTQTLTNKWTEHYLKIRQLFMERWAKEYELAVDTTLRMIEMREQLESKDLAAREEIYKQREEWRRDAIEQTIGMEAEALAVAREAQLRQLEMVDVQTLRQKIAVEQAKFGIEREYLAKSFDFQIKQLVRLSELEIQTKQMAARIAGAGDAEIDAIRLDREAKLASDVGKMSADANANVAAARDRAMIQSVQVTRDHYKQIFDSLKHSAEGVFDALLTKSQSIFSAIGDALKTAVLTAIKEIVSSRVAATLMQLLYGVKVNFAGAGAGGGILGGRLGAVLGIGAPAVFGAGSITGGPGGTGGFAGPVGIPGWQGALGAQGSPISGGWGTGTTAVGPGAGITKAGMLQTGLMAGGTMLAAGGLQRGGTSGALMTTAGGAAMGVGIASSLGLSAAGMGWLGAGLGLAAAGVKQGGVAGLAMTTGGGALAGFQLGGPIGAAIGAAAGFVIGLIGLFRKGAEEKAKEKIKAAYGVEIKEKNILKQIVDMAKSSFGGSLDMAIRSPQIRELVELYAMSTAQKMPWDKTVAASMPRPLSVSMTGGMMTETPTYYGGVAAPGQMALGRGLPNLTNLPAVAATLKVETAVSVEAQRILDLEKRDIPQTITLAGAMDDAAIAILNLRPSAVLRTIDLVGAVDPMAEQIMELPSRGMTGWLLNLAGNVSTEARKILDLASSEVTRTIKAVGFIDRTAQTVFAPELPTLRRAIQVEAVVSPEVRSLLESQMLGTTAQRTNISRLANLGSRLMGPTATPLVASRIQEPAKTQTLVVTELRRILDVLAADRNINVKLDGPATTGVLQGEVAKGVTGRSVQTATGAGLRASIGRRANMALNVSPGLLTA